MTSQNCRRQFTTFLIPKTDTGRATVDNWRYVGGGVFACPEQNRERNLNSELESNSEEGERINKGSLLLEESEDKQTHVARAERRRKEKQVVAECPHPKANLWKSDIIGIPTAKAPIEDASQ